jgi:hypothetical protein
MHPTETKPEFVRLHSNQALLNPDPILAPHKVRHQRRAKRSNANHRANRSSALLSIDSVCEWHDMHVENNPVASWEWVL